MEAETEIIHQTVSEQTQTEAASDPQPEETEEDEAQAASAEASQAEARQLENEVSEVEIPNVGKILVLSDADGYNEEVKALSNYKNSSLYCLYLSLELTCKFRCIQDLLYYKILVFFFCFKHV